MMEEEIVSEGWTNASAPFLFIDVHSSPSYYLPSPRGSPASPTGESN